MDLVREKIRSFLQQYYKLDLQSYYSENDTASLLKFLVDRRNASFGDSLINFIYSCSKTLARNECTGIKISDEILLKGFKKSKLYSWLKLPGKKKDQGNALEALIFFMWLNYNYSIEEMALCILSRMNNSGLNLNNEIEEKRIAGSAFTHLFDSFHDLLVNPEKKEKING